MLLLLILRWVSQLKGTVGSRICRRENKDPTILLGWALTEISTAEFGASFDVSMLLLLTLIGLLLLAILLVVVPPPPLLFLVEVVLRRVGDKA